MQIFNITCTSFQISKQRLQWCKLTTPYSFISKFIRFFNLRVCIVISFFSFVTSTFVLLFSICFHTIYRYWTYMQLSRPPLFYFSVSACILFPGHIVCFTAFPISPTLLSLFHQLCCRNFIVQLAYYLPYFTYTAPASCIISAFFTY